MKIVTCFKLSLNPDRIIEEDYKNFSPDSDLSYAGSELGCFDSSSLEYGLKLKEHAAAGGEEVSCTALTVSSALSKSFAENLFAAGYDEVICINSESPDFSQRNTAKLLAEEIKAIGADLILTGKEASLAETGSVPYFLSEFLKLPLLEDAEALELKESAVEAVLQRASGTFKIKAELPLVCSIGNSPEVLRYSTLKARMKCRGKSVVSRSVPALEAEDPGIFIKPETERSCKMLSADLETLYRDVLCLLKQAGKAEQKQGAGKDLSLQSAAGSAPLFLERRKDFNAGSDVLLQNTVSGRSLYFEINGLYEADLNSLKTAAASEDRGNASLYIFTDNATGRKAALKLAESKALPIFFGVEITALNENTVTVKKRVCASNLEWQKDLTLPAVLTLPEALIKTYSFKHIAGLSANDKPVYIKSETFLAPREETDLSSAALVIAAGSGMGTKENCETARELAKALNGAFGLTRPAALNTWGTQAEIIGQSGTLTSPDCCLVLGAAGAGAFAAGIEKAKTVIAVNTDKNALIFKNADYGILTDAKTFTEELLKTIKEKYNC